MAVSVADAAVAADDVAIATAAAAVCVRRCHLVPQRRRRRATELQDIVSGACFMRKTGIQIHKMITAMSNGFVRRNAEKAVSGTQTIMTREVVESRTRKGRRSDSRTTLTAATTRTRTRTSASKKAIPWITIAHVLSTQTPTWQFGASYSGRRGTAARLIVGGQYNTERANLIGQE